MGNNSSTKDNDPGQDNITSGKYAYGQQESIGNWLDEAKGQYQGGMDQLGNMQKNITDFYSTMGNDGEAYTIDPDQMGKAQVNLFGGGDVEGTIRDRLGNVNTVKSGLEDVGYTAGQTSIGGLQRGAGTGLSNVFNNLQVSTAGAEMAAREADQSLAASQDLAAQAGTGAGGATALAAAAAKSKAGISADIDRQVKANEMARAQGEQSLQRELLAQGNLASQFDLGQDQFNVGAANQAAQFGAQARNQANQFNATTQNQWQQQSAQMMNAMDQFNLSNQNAAFAAQTAAKNNAIAQNASIKNNWALQKAGGQTQHQSNQWDALMGMVELWSADYQKAQEAWAENESVIGLAAMEGWTPPPKGAPAGYAGHTGANNYYTQNPYQNPQTQGGYSGAGNDAGTGQYGSAPSVYDFSTGPTG
tara:strand:+ start:465 stop:1718 length:1254 start_codon:yes stop_codon:yes gene_type:complete